MIVNYNISIYGDLDDDGGLSLGVRPWQAGGNVRETPIGLPTFSANRFTRQKQGGLAAQNLVRHKPLCGAVLGGDENRNMSGIGLGEGSLNCPKTEVSGNGCFRPVVEQSYRGRGWNEVNPYRGVVTPNKCSYHSILSRVGMK